MPYFPRRIFISIVGFFDSLRKAHITTIIWEKKKGLNNQPLLAPSILKMLLSGSFLLLCHISQRYNAINALKDETTDPKKPPS